MPWRVFRFGEAGVKFSSLCNGLRCWKGNRSRRSRRGRCITPSRPGLPRQVLDVLALLSMRGLVTEWGQRMEVRLGGEGGAKFCSAGFLNIGLKFLFFLLLCFSCVLGFRVGGSFQAWLRV